jgi:hypothetical protein
MTYKELYEAIKPFATDKVYQNDIVVVIYPSEDRFSMRVVAVTDDGEIEVD